MRLLKNLPASVKARLLATAKKRGESFNLVLARYGVERLLYHLSQSPHKDRFLLKGAMLFAVWDDKIPRPTRDVDFLAFGPTDIDLIKGVFQEIVQVSVPNDGLRFESRSIHAEGIREDDDYGGVRLRLHAWLAKAEVPVQVDLGSGDVVTPAPENVVFPALLDFPAPHLRAYPIYTVVAEKFEAMVKLDLQNTRMKDFYDLWFLSRRFEFEGPTLHKAIRATFTRRGTELGDRRTYALTKEFARDETKQTQWAVFLNRNGLSGAPAQFSALMGKLREFLAPVSRVDAPTGQWHPATGWSAQ